MEHESTIIESLPVPVRSRWADAVETIRQLAGQSAYAFRPPLSQSEIYSLRAKARWHGMLLAVRQHPSRNPVETRVWYTRLAGGNSRKQKERNGQSSQADAL